MAFQCTLPTAPAPCCRMVRVSRSVIEDLPDHLHDLFDLDGVHIAAGCRDGHGGSDHHQAEHPSDPEPCR